MKGRKGPSLTHSLTPLLPPPVNARGESGVAQLSLPRSRNLSVDSPPRRGHACVLGVVTNWQSINCRRRRRRRRRREVSLVRWSVLPRLVTCNHDDKVTSPARSPRIFVTLHIRRRRRRHRRRPLTSFSQPLSHVRIRIYVCRM